MADQNSVPTGVDASNSGNSSGTTTNRRALPVTVRGLSVVLWTPDVARDFMQREQAFVDAHQGGDGSGRVYDDRTLYVNDEGALVSPQFGMPTLGNVFDLVDSDSTPLPTPPARATAIPDPFADAEANDPRSDTHVAVPIDHLSAWRRLLGVIERGESLAEHELQAFVQSVEHALHVGTPTA